MTTIPMPLINKLMTQSPTRKLLAIAICGLGTLSVTTAPVYADEDGSFWTQFVPSADTRLIFVSSEDGNDNNSGLNPNAPVKTLAKGYELLRDGYPDWMLLKRGDVWYEGLPNWGKSGRAADQRMLVGAYGNETVRPQIRPDGGTTGLNCLGNGAISDVAFVGFHLEPNGRAFDQTGTGIRWLKNAQNILFEDLYIDGFKDNIVLQASGDTFLLRDFHINGCVIVDAWSNIGHSQGLFAKGVDGLTIENSIFDHNGWNPETGSDPTIFRHNIYVQRDTNNVIFRNNITSDAAATGIQMRSGGLATNNLFISNPVSLVVGGGVNPTTDPAQATISRNLFMHGRDLTPSIPRGVGLSIEDVTIADVSHNYFAHSNIGPNHQPIMLSGNLNLMPTGINIYNNIIYDWRGEVQLNGTSSNNSLQDVQFHDNTIIRDLSLSDRPIVLRLPESSDQYLHLARNTYKYFQPHANMFRAGTAYYAPSEWAEFVDQNATFITLDTAPQHLGIEQYLQSIEISGDIDFFINKARSLSRSNTNKDFHAPRVIEWFESRVSATDMTDAE